MPLLTIGNRGKSTTTADITNTNRMSENNKSTNGTSHSNSKVNYNTLPKIKMAFMKDATRRNKNLSCPIESGIIWTLVLPPNHQLAEQSMNLGQNPSNRCKTAINLITKGLAIHQPPITKTMNKMMDIDRSETDASETEEHEVLISAANEFEAQLKKLESADTASSQTPVLKTLIDVCSSFWETMQNTSYDVDDNELVDGWEDLLVKPVIGHNEGHSTGVMIWNEANEITVKLVFHNRFVALAARCALLYWAASIEVIMNEHSGLKSLIDKFHALNIDPVSEAGWSIKTSKKNTSAKNLKDDSLSISDEIQLLYDENDHSINMGCYSGYAARALTTITSAVDDMHERYVSLELTDFVNPINTNLEHSAEFDEFLNAAHIVDGSECKVMRILSMNPQNTKAFIITPEKYVVRILQSNYDNRICKINHTITETRQKKPSSINLSHTYSIWMNQQIKCNESSHSKDATVSMSDEDPINRNTVTRWNNNSMTLSMIARLGAKVKAETKNLEKTAKQANDPPPSNTSNSSDTTPTLNHSPHRPDTTNHRPRKIVKRETYASTSVQQLTSQLNELKLRFEKSQQTIQQLQQQLLQHAQSINQSTEIEHKQPASSPLHQQMDESNVNVLINKAVKDSLATMLEPLIDAAKNLANQQRLTDLKLYNIASMFPAIDSKTRKRSRSVGPVNQSPDSPKPEPSSKVKKIFSQQTKSTSTQVNAVSTSNGTAVSQC